MPEPFYRLVPHEVILVANVPACNFCVKPTPGPYDFKTEMGPWANGARHYSQSQVRRAGRRQGPTLDHARPGGLMSLENFRDINFALMKGEVAVLQIRVNNDLKFVCSITESEDDDNLVEMTIITDEVSDEVKSFKVVSE